MHFIETKYFLENKNLLSVVRRVLCGVRNDELADL
jgi:hypothetical protein